MPLSTLGCVVVPGVMFSPGIAHAALGIALMVLNAPGGVAPGAVVRSGTVVFGGDVLPHGEVMAAIRAHGGDSLLAPVAPVLRAADVALVNLESSVAASRPQTQTPMRLNVHPDFLGPMVAAGIDGAIVANNHAFDAGVDGVGETVTALRAAGLRAVGGALAGEDPLAPQEFPLAGGTLCVFAAARLLNDEEMQLPGADHARIGLARLRPLAEREALLGAIQRDRGRCGAILVSLHSGSEYTELPDGGDRVYFHRVAAAGADVVIAHHSHIPQPVELFSTNGRRVPIFYSLGNFVSNQGASAEAGASVVQRGRYEVSLDARTREGLLAVVRFESTSGPALRVAEFGYVPLWTLNTHRRVPAGQPAMIAAALMPRDGGADVTHRQRWQRLVQRVGAAYLLPMTSVPGAAEAHARSEQTTVGARPSR